MHNNITPQDTAGQVNLHESQQLLTCSEPGVAGCQNCLRLEKARQSVDLKVSSLSLK